LVFVPERLGGWAVCLAVAVPAHALPAAIGAEVNMRRVHMFVEPMDRFAESGLVVTSSDWSQRVINSGRPSLFFKRRQVDLPLTSIPNTWR